MSDTSTTAQDTGAANSEETLAALFAQLVIQQANMAMMLMGKVAHPQTGETTKDLDAARLFVDELEMLEAKTKGNLTKEESALLKQTLMSLRLAFVEAVESPEPKKAEAAAPPKAQPEAEPATPQSNAAAAAAEDEHRKKFSKKY